MFDRVFGKEVQFQTLNQALKVSNCCHVILCSFNSTHHMRSCILDVLSRKGLWQDLENLVSLKIELLLSSSLPSVYFAIDTKAIEDKRTEELLVSLYQLLGKLYSEQRIERHCDDGTREVLSTSLLSGIMKDEDLKRLSYERSTNLIEIVRQDGIPYIKNKLYSLLCTLSVLITQTATRNISVSLATLVSSINDLNSVYGNLEHLKIQEGLLDNCVLRIERYPELCASMPSVPSVDVARIGLLDQDAIEDHLKTIDPEGSPELTALLMERYIQLRDSSAPKRERVLRHNR